MRRRKWSWYSPNHGEVYNKSMNHNFMYSLYDGDQGLHIAHGSHVTLAAQTCFTHRFVWVTTYAVARKKWHSLFKESYKS
ncbi:hypothetical protein RND71_000083 [Anisodus tanguticus]|uniref:Uncharacterized protein n=1 Tax=Anisodus tanguticus TaxID=243964 RepID=A0AAE1VUY1_9SOLA|nr:hypothetical protein RND71_000083 [Anisodus tanguticus]